MDDDELHNKWAWARDEYNKCRKWINEEEAQHPYIYRACKILLLSAAIATEVVGFLAGQPDVIDEVLLVLTVTKKAIQISYNLYKMVKHFFHYHKQPIERHEHHEARLASEIGDDFSDMGSSVFNGDSDAGGANDVVQQPCCILS
jgi:hypothetical protein